MGAFLSNLQNTKTGLAQGFPPKSKFSVEQIPDLTGRIAIVTGGNVGIGYETIKALLQHNAKVYMASRSKEKADAAIASLKEATGKEAIFLELDLSSLASVKMAAQEYLSKEHELHILFNNAGVMWPPVDQVTKDGYDLQFGTNVLGHFYFTELLMPALLAGVASAPDHHTRVITTSSSGAYFDTLHWDTFKDGPARRKMNSQSLYFQSKLGNAVVANQVAKRYADKGIISISVNPGNIRSELQRYVPAFTSSRSPLPCVQHYMLYPTPYGALTQLFAGTMPEALNYNGEFLIPWARLGKCRAEAYDPEVGERLWKWLDEQVKAFEASQTTTA
ncbi:NAD(P)-binding protein [Pilatotrama ljubarskyi]|nr:NAD(P)-binding protein [Pilatotrama ljubarskyi]